MLQWGHAFDRVEIAVFQIAASRMTPWLQWGHAFDRVEITATLTDGRRVPIGFNGATLLIAWK